MDEKDYKYLALHDELTGAKNRKALDCDLESANQETLCIVSVDVNDLKYTNDTYGHKYGDLLLTTVCNGLFECFGKENVYRTGGDEFIIYMDGVRDAIIQKKIAQFNDILKAANEESEDITFAASLGAAYGDGTKTVSAVMDEADRAMYSSKREYKKEHPHNTALINSDKTHIKSQGDIPEMEVWLIRQYKEEYEDLKKDYIKERNHMIIRAVIFSVICLYIISSM